MTDAFLQMPLTQMVDLVINSPEEGVVNFNLLHTVLHVLVKQLNAQDVSVELHGPAAQRLQNVIKTDGTSHSVNVTAITSTAAASGSVEKKDNATETVYVVQPVDSAQNCSMTVTKKHLDAIQNEIAALKEKLQELTDLPGNMGIINAVRTETCSPVFDMFQILTLAKRIDAAEIGMSKVASIVEDLIKNPAYAERETVCTKASRSKLDEEPVKRAKSVSRSKTSVVSQHSQQKIDEVTEEKLKPEEIETPPSDAIAYLMEELAGIKELLNVDKMGAEAEDGMTLAEVFEVVAQLRDKLLLKRSSIEDGGEEIPLVDLPPDVQLTLLEDKFNEYTKHMKDMDRGFNDELAKLHNQFTDIEKDFNEVLLKIQGGLPAGDSDSNQCCAAVYGKIAKLQADFEALTDTSAKLLEDKDEKQQKMDLMLEQIELLKTVKADKEDIEEALAEKADACTVHRKVSHDQFDNACDELYKGIEEALGKLSQQEELWQHALDDIQSEIGSKLDKMDLGPLRDFINNKLRQLQDKMRSLAALKREQEAAGTKSKLLRDVNCISCDKDVVMKKEMDTSFKPHPYSAPPTRSMAPYLAYELDALRKQQKGVPGARNMNNLEAALTGRGGKKAEDHICNRYCGGSHTLTTPQQRVTRLGHFLLQWGPEAIPKEEKNERLEKEVQTRSQSVVVQGDILSSSKKSITNNAEHSSTSKMGIAKSGTKTVSRGSVRVSQAPRPNSVEDKKTSELKRTSQQSVKSVRSNKSATKSKVIEEAIAESPVEEVAVETPEPPTTETESTVPPPASNEDVEGEGEVPAELSEAGEASPVAEEAADVQADEDSLPPEE